MIKIFDVSETSFLTNGLGVLEAISCIENKFISLNGWYLECTFSSKYQNLIKQDRILYVNTKEKGGQPFRIHNIEKTDSYIKLIANHVGFDSERYMLIDVEPSGLSPISFLTWINNRLDQISPFTVTSNVEGSGSKLFDKVTYLDALKETETLFSGVFDFDKFKISFLQKVGNDNESRLSYGKNIESTSIFEDWGSVCTKVYPIGPQELMLPEGFLKSEVQYESAYTKKIQFDIPTSYKENDIEIKYSNAELISMLRSEAKSYLEDAQYPKISYKIKSDIDQTLHIGDIVTVIHPLVELKTTVQSYRYDIITERVLTLEFGNYERSVKKNFDLIREKLNHANEKIVKVYDIVREQTDLINHLNKDGFVYIDENEILILDKLPKEEAKQVWRFGLGGIGFSNNGYKGPFEYAFTQNGEFNIDFIKANSITVNKLASDVASTLDLSSNKSIKLIIEEISKVVEAINGTIVSETSPLDPKDGQVWIDTSTEPVIQKVWNEMKTEWLIVNNLDDVRNQIESINTSLELESGKIQTLVEQNTTIINGNEVTLKEAYSYMQQTVDSIQFAISESGGMNKIHNSVGINATNFWKVTGSVDTEMSVEIRNNTISGNAFKLRSGSLMQTFNTIVGHKYAVSCKVKKSTNTCFAAINHGLKTEFLFNLDTEHVDHWITFSFYFEATEYDATIEISSSGDELLISDIMVNDGEIPQQWSSNNDEIYTQNVRIDKEGISVYQENSDNKMVIDTVQMANYYNDKEVFTINGDWSSMQNLRVMNEMEIGEAHVYSPKGGLDIAIVKRKV